VNELNASNFVDILRRRVLQTPPHQNAYTFLGDGETEEVSFTYADLDQRARAIGAMLQSQTAPGARALLLYPPGLDYIAAFFGCLYAGVVAVPAYPPHRARVERALPRLQAIARDARPAIALTTSPIQDILSASAAQTHGLSELHWLATDTIADQLADDWRPPALTGESLAFLQYTSGSTSTPRGVMVSHANLLHNQRMIRQAFAHTEHACIVGWLPLYHDMGLIGNVLQPLYLGVPCILMSPMSFLQSPFRWLQAISRYRATTSGGPNFAYDLCVRKISPEQRATLDLGCWQVAFNGAEPVRADTLERFTAAFAPCGFRRQAFYPCYGLAEATLFVAGGAAEVAPSTHTFQRTALSQGQAILVAGDQPDQQTLVSCGQSWSDQRIEIVAAGTDVACSPGQVGEIWVSGASVAQGYWDRPDETQHTFRATLADGAERVFLRTGDLGFIQNGELFVTGRADCRNFFYIAGQ
jgi:acyl-CoA synthetase (AMP-forming)/AMP-acid ligase II